MHVFSWHFEDHQDSTTVTQSSWSPIHHSSSTLAMERNYLSKLLTFEDIIQRLPVPEEESLHDISCAFCLKLFIWKFRSGNLAITDVFQKLCFNRWLLYDARFTCPFCRSCLITMSSSTWESSCRMPQHQQSSWSVEGILYLFGNDLLCSSSYS